jgi:hypothetical protein
MVDNRAQFGIAWSPAKFLAGFVGTGDELGRVPFSSFSDVG